MFYTFYYAITWLLLIILIYIYKLDLYLPSSLEFINNEIERLTNHYEKYKVIYQLIDERYTLIEVIYKYCINNNNNIFLI